MSPLSSPTHFGRRDTQEKTVGMECSQDPGYTGVRVSQSLGPGVTQPQQPRVRVTQEPWPPGGPSQGQAAEEQWPWRPSGICWRRVTGSSHFRVGVCPAGRRGSGLVHAVELCVHAGRCGLQTEVPSQPSPASSAPHSHLSVTSSLFSLSPILGYGECDFPEE